MPLYNQGDGITKYSIMKFGWLKMKTSIWQETNVSEGKIAMALPIQIQTGRILSSKSFSLYYSRHQSITYY